MSHYPTTREGRVAARQELKDAIMAEARRKELIRGRSMKCGGWDGRFPPKHAGTDDGCGNDGTTCVCECHDRLVGEHLEFGGEGR